MAEKIVNALEGWRVKLSDGEYELTQDELGTWVEVGRVGDADLVRPPVTRRWKRAENASELSVFFRRRRVRLDEAERKQRLALEEAARPAREARQRRKAAFVGGGFLGLFGGPMAALACVASDHYGAATLGVVAAVLGFVALVYASTMRI